MRVPGIDRTDRCDSLPAPGTQTARVRPEPSEAGSHLCEAPRSAAGEWVRGPRDDCRALRPPDEHSNIGRQPGVALGEGETDDRDVVPGVSEAARLLADATVV